jgi:chemotaxis family two-component system sensor kinase Cph1
LSEPRDFNSDYAQSIVKLQAEGKSFDRDICEREPIRTPGTIQPHGALIGLRGENDAIAFASENIGTFLGADAAAVLGKSAREFLPAALVDALTAERSEGLLSSINPVCFSQRLALQVPSACWVHQRDGTTFIEFENVSDIAEGDAGQPGAVERAIVKIRDADSMKDLDRIVLEAILDITGYQRVLIYAFDQDWNGVTTAEAMRGGDYQPFLGLRFPASDIPRQARELYSENLLRFMADRDAVPSRLVALDTSVVADLSGARLRAQSPVHLEYQRNINVNGAMSASVMKRGKLWGLIVGHHHDPLHVAPAAAIGVGSIVQSYSMRLNDLEDRSLRSRRAEQQRIYSSLLEQMAVRDDFADALASGPIGLPALLDANGAAIVRDGKVRRLGDTPPEETILQVLRNQNITNNDGIIATDHAAEWDAALAPHARIASGVLIVPLRDELQTRIIWFRPGITETVNWAGNPHKAMHESGAYALPRRSFERWTEQRSGRSAPWTLADIETATSLGFAIGEVILRHGRKIQALSQRLFNAERTTAAQDVTEIALRSALQEKEAEMQQKNFLLREVDHRVRNSLALISSMLQLQARSTLDPSVRQQFIEASRRVITVGHVHQRLYQTGELRSLDFGDYLRALTSDLSDSAGPDTKKRLVLETTAVTLNAETVIPLGLIVNELVTNAFKHGEKKPSPLTVNVSFLQSDAGMRLTVQDDGPGLPEGFDPGKNTGLGMRLVSGLILQLSGNLEFESSDAGTRFTILVPKKGEISAALPQ